MNNTRRKLIDTAIETASNLTSQIEALIEQIAAIRDEEQDYFYNMPELFQVGAKGDTANDAINALDAAISDLECIDIASIESYLIDAKGSPVTRDISNDRPSATTDLVLTYRVKEAFKDYGEEKIIALNGPLNSATDGASLIYRQLTGKSLNSRKTDWHVFGLQSKSSRLVCMNTDGSIDFVADFSMRKA